MNKGAGKFVMSSYQENDAFGREVLVNWLNDQEWVKEVHSKEDYGVDITIKDHNGDEHSFEAEVKTNYPWTDMNSFKFNTVSFLGRKKKWEEKGFYYALICKETKAICIAHSSTIYKKEHREELIIDTSDRSGADAFYRVPKEECNWIAPTSKNTTMTPQAWENYTTKLKESSKAVWKVAQYLHSFKYTVTVPAVHIAGSPEEYADYIDEGDIILHRKNINDIIEVKHQSWDWTSHSDIPWAEIIVCAKKSFDRHTQKPSAYFLVNKQLSHALVIQTENCGEWTVKDIHDKKKDWIQTMYMITPSNYQFIQL